MVLPRGSESWRRMSRFRRQSLVKPLAAEVLEPRCLMTEATGTLTAADATPLTGAVVIGPDLWDDAGLTLQQIGDLLHVFRVGTQINVVPPFVLEKTAAVFLIDPSREDYDWLLALPIFAHPPSDVGSGSVCCVGIAKLHSTGMNIDLLMIPRLGFSLDEWENQFWKYPVTDDFASDNNVFPNNGGDLSLWASQDDVLLIGQGIAAVGIEDRELAELDTASSDSAFGELADSEPEDGGGLAANGDTNSADLGDELKLEAALSDELLASLAEQPT